MTKIPEIINKVSEGMKLETIPIENHHNHEKFNAIQFIIKPPNKLDGIIYFKYNSTNSQQTLPFAIFVVSAEPKLIMIVIKDNATPNLKSKSKKEKIGIQKFDPETPIGLIFDFF